jgi:hypothetical protein
MKEKEILNDITQATYKAISEVVKLLPVNYYQFELLIAQKIKESLSPFCKECNVKRLYTITPEEEVDLARAGVSGLRIEMWNEKMHFRISCRKGKDETNFSAIIRVTIMRLYKYSLAGETTKWKEEITEETIVPVIHEYWVGGR